MKINLTDREWRHVQIALLQSMSHADKFCKEIKFEDTALIKELLKIHDKIAKARGITYEKTLN